MAICQLLKMKSIYSLTSLCIALSLATPLTQAADSTPAAATDKPAETASAPKAEKPIELPDPVAVVDGTEIKKSELTEAFDAVVAQAGKKSEEISNSQRLDGYTAILNDMVIDKIMAKVSAKQEVSAAEVDAAFDKSVKLQFETVDKMNEELKKNGQSVDKIKTNIRTALQEQKWIEAQIAGKDPVTDVEAQEFYDKHPEYFKMPDTVRASHILIAIPEDAKPEEIAAKEKKAKEIAGKAKNGDDFAKLAKENSEDPGSKDTGGDLDFFSRDRMVPAFADAAFKMNKGDISDPVKTEFGFHIIKVTDKKESHVVPFAEVKEKIIGYLKNSKQKQATEELVKRLREKATVKIFLPAPEEKAPEVKAPETKAPEVKTSEVKAPEVTPPAETADKK